MRYQEVTTTRDVEAVQIPQGNIVTIPADTPVVIMQSLGDTYTVQAPTMGGLYRVAGHDADAIGEQRPQASAALAATTESGPVDEQVIWDQLRKVYDPELPVNVVDLGLIYELHVVPLPSGGSHVEVKMTLTTPGCGMGQIIATDAKRRIESVPGVTAAAVEVVFDPPWSPQMMSEAARLQLGLL